MGLIRKEKHEYALRFIFTLLAAISLALMVSACQPDNQAVENNVEAVQEEPTPVPSTPEPLPDQSAYHEAMASSAMGMYDLGHGPNTWCSRCHSPQNWDPEAFVGPPPNCMTCKFPTDAELRVAEGNPLVTEEEWVGIPCESCHEVDENGIASAEIAWLNPVAMEYVSVNNPTELCEKCHVTTTGNSFGSGVDHKITLGGSAHLNYGGFLGGVTPPQYCTDCHDPHSQVPKQCEDCHDVRDLDTHIKGKNALHADVTCMACHDAEGYDVGPHPDEEMGGIWVTQVTTMGRSGPSTDFVLSHSPTYEVLCNKCHFEANLWGLTEYTEEGEIPEVDICKDGETLTVPKPDLDQYGEVDVGYTMGECPEAEE